MTAFPHSESDLTEVNTSNSSQMVVSFYRYIHLIIFFFYLCVGGTVGEFSFFRVAFRHLPLQTS